ncbi:hypothetical protein N9H63_00380 [bacterium]|nr:hypothetical protein [bacterium]
MDLIQFLEDNDLGDFIKKYFNGDSQSFMKFLQSKNLIEEMMDHLIEQGYLTDVMTMYYEENPKFVVEFLLGYLDDVTMEGGKYWMTIDREDMSKFFANDREDSKALAKLILQEDTPFLDIDSNIYNLTDFIGDLTPENVSYLKSLVYNEVESQEVEIDGVKDIVTVDVINNMDDDKLSNFIKENSPDVLSELERINRNAEESAIYDELYDDVMNGLRYLFDEHFFSREIPYKRKTYKAGTNEPIEVQDFHYQVDVTKLLPQVVKTVLSWGGYESDNDFEYYGSLESLLEYYLYEEGEQIRVSWPEWADDEIVREFINDNFQDYL